MTEEKKKSWFRRHWILSTILTFILLIIIGNVFGPAEKNGLKEPGDQLISLSAAAILPQEGEIPREWVIGSSRSIRIEVPGFEEARELIISKKESFLTTTLTMQVYKFDGPTSAQSYYDSETQKINIRGVKEIDLGANCFGIDQDINLKSDAKAYCINRNVVYYVESASDSFSYVPDLRSFKSIIDSKI